MNFLNQALNQFGELFRSMTVGARITAALLLAVVVISLAYLFNSQVSSGNEYLLGGQAFSADEINQMEAAWGKAGLTTYQVDGSRIRVPRGQRSAYMGALADQGALPAKWGWWLEQMAADASPLASPREQEVKRKVYLQQQIKQVLESMSGVERAMVLLDVEQRKGFRAEKVATASVNIQPSAKQPLTDETAETIKATVAYSVAGLTPDRVAVTDLLTQRSFRSSPEGSAGARGDVLLSQKRRYQDDFRSRIQQALRDVPGVDVAVNVELSGELEQTSRTTEIDPKAAVVIHSQKETQRSVTSGGGPGGRPGVVAQQRGANNQPANLAAAGGASPTREEDQNSTLQDSIVPHGETHALRSGLVPQRVTVSVGVPGSYFRKVWESRNPQPAGAAPQAPSAQDLGAIEQEQVKKIRDHVLRLIPTPPGVDPTELVTVTSFPELPAELLPETPLTSEAMQWLAQSWTTLGLFGLSVVSLLILRSTIRSAPASATIVETPVASAEAPHLAEAPSEASGEPAAEGSTVPGGPRIKRRRLHGPTMRDDLVEIVREDPEAAAKILRGWIGAATS